MKRLLAVLMSSMLAAGNAVMPLSAQAETNSDSIYSCSVVNEEEQDTDTTDDVLRNTMPSVVGQDLGIDAHTSEKRTLVDYGDCSASGSDVKWGLYSQDDTNENYQLLIFGNGDIADYGVTDSSSSPWYEYNNKIREVSIENGVTGIGKYAFKYCENLKKVKISNSVTSIAEFAFYGCYNLENITIPKNVSGIGNCAFGSCISLTDINVDEYNKSYASQDGVLFSKDKTRLVIYPGGKKGIYNVPDGVVDIGNYSFYDCTNISNITLPDSIVRIEDHAFAGCAYLTSIIIPDGVTFIGDYAFMHCVSLKSITIPNSVTYIGELAFDGCIELTSIEIPDKLTTLNNGVFLGCTGLTNIIIPDSVTDIGNQAFYQCTGLTDVVIPNSVTNLGGYAFGECRGLTDIIIPDSVTHIGYRAFSGCTGLTSVTIPKNVTEMEILVFENCTNLTSIIVDEENKNFFAQDGVLFNKDRTRLINYPIGKSGAYTIPDSVEIIRDNAFKGCTGLTSVLIPNSVTTIEWSAFENCSGLTEITVPDSVVEIENAAFKDSIGLTKAVIPEAFDIDEAKTTIFEGCYNLESITHPYRETVVVVMGDLNGDNIVNQKDAYIVIRHCSGVANSILTDNTKLQLADVTEDGVVKTNDAVNIQRYSMGLKCAPSVGQKIEVKISNK